MIANHVAENTICGCSTGNSCYFNAMTQHFFGAQISYQFATMHTVSYEFLMKPEESAGCHQTLSLLGGGWARD